MPAGGTMVESNGSDSTVSSDTTDSKDDLRIVNSQSWYVIQMKDRGVALSELAAMGYETYSPVVKVMGKRKEYERALFGWYAFVRFDISVGGWTRIWNTRGIRKLLGERGSEYPTPCRGNAIERMIELEKCVGVEKAAEIVFQKGNEVIISTGAFAGHQGIVEYVNRNQVSILLYLLGRRISVKLKSNQLEARFKSSPAEATTS
jgi:transcriptional antiterminator RfaH